jgi:hypothetical protein
VRAQQQTKSDDARVAAAPGTLSTLMQQHLLRTIRLVQIQIIVIRLEVIGMIQVYTAQIG